MKKAVFTLVFMLVTSGLFARDIYIFIGQSNMLGISNKDNLTTSDRNANNIFGWDGSKYISSPDPGGNTDDIYHAEAGSYINGFHGPVLAAMQVARDITGKQVYFIKLAFDGSPLHPDLSLPGGTDLNWSEVLYSRLITRCSGAINSGDEVKAVFFMQGETDAIQLTSTTSKQYITHLNNLKTKIINDFNCNNFIVGRIKKGYTYSNDIRAAQELHSWINTDDLSINQDNIHYSTKGLLTLGRRMMCKAHNFQLHNDTIFKWIHGHWYQLNNAGVWGIAIFGHGYQCNKAFLTDITGDSIPDAVAYFASHGSWYVSPGSYSNGFGPLSMWAFAHGVNSDGQILTDIDDDGDKDAVIYFASTGEFYVAVSNGLTFDATKLWVNLSVKDGAIFYKYLLASEE